MVLYLVAYHALSNPRSAEIPLTRSLRQNGLAFFLMTFTLRLANMFISIYGRPTLVFPTILCVPIPLPLSISPILMSSSFIWSAVTINLNHSLLRLRRADVKYYLIARNSGTHRVASSFGLHRLSGTDFDQEALNEFDDIRTKVDDELKLQPLESSSQRQRVITISFGMTGKSPLSSQIHREGSLTLPYSLHSSAMGRHPKLAYIVVRLPFSHVLFVVPSFNPLIVTPLYIPRTRISYFTPIWSRPGAGVITRSFVYTCVCACQCVTTSNSRNIHIYPAEG